MADRPFRVIIAGGGYSGLVTALALEKASIEFVLLEARDIAPHLGASISVHPHVQVVLEQLGVWPEIEAGVIPLTDREHFDQHGTMFDNSDVLGEISRQTNGGLTLFMERKFLLQCVYNQIAGKTKVRARTGFVSYAEHEDCIHVTTDSGETIRGDILIGADGVHSAVRAHMAEQLRPMDLATSQKLLSSFVARYHCIFATSHNSNAAGKPFLPDAMVHNVYYPNFSGIAAVGVQGLVFWFLFVKSEATTRTPDTPRYSEEDMHATIDKYGGFALGPGYTFHDLWDARIKAAMVPLEEGVLPTKWSNSGRVVLLGDAVHKATINPGLGGNLAVEGVVALVNSLRAALTGKTESADKKDKQRLSTVELQHVFQKYEREQRPRADKIVSLSGYVTRLEAMETWWLRLLRRVMPWFSAGTKASVLVGHMKEAQCLEFLPNPEGGFRATAAV
ncbi:uncharacterized protein B0I36DRAFT_376800 [Microdochium trichocladiopsis]|uniref:FAD-binding domain-containing protein n=1 Tax=Microdochium trichocladiopsis TaxID=1682393 RepID=A0A9P9BM52_9PEZI|nr:uncharacterized protein B0I36DRAFT_376800 [Microdochium trichocladiopsis]KAH7025105.1 hypothetical protein B0I36DRAFT_376800 [Microdochium trichocladiopsis]